MIRHACGASHAAAALRLFSAKVTGRPPRDSFNTRRPYAAATATGAATASATTATPPSAQALIARNSSPCRPMIACAGGGVYFFWQAGAVRAIRESGAVNLDACQFRYVSISVNDAVEQKLESTMVRKREIGSRTGDTFFVSENSETSVLFNPPLFSAFLSDSSPFSPPISGASAGSLIATLAACNVPMDAAVRLALTIADEAELWTRSAGMYTILSCVCSIICTRLTCSRFHKSMSDFRHCFVIFPLEFSKETKKTIGIFASPSFWSDFFIYFF